jgi:tRNA(fMet)-specific endonuclease VapC
MTNPLPTLIDTDILSSIMRKHTLATQRARTYLELQGNFTFSVITRYEILRGLLAKGTTRQLALFSQLCATSHVLPITDDIIVRAATIYADLHQRGELISDADS